MDLDSRTPGEAALDAAFKAGAEAMRTLAADYVDCTGWRDGDGILDLAIPERKR